MKRKESMFFRALGEIPESYIDELTQWQKEHDSDVPSGHTKPTLRTDELPDQKEEMIMKQTAAYSADKNKEAGISVRKLRPVTIGIFASLAACAVIAVGFGSRFIGLNSPDSKPAVSLEEESETEPLKSEDEGAPQTEVVDENPSSAEETTFTESVSEEDRILELYSCYGDDSETSGIPEIPKNSVMQPARRWRRLEKTSSMG